MSENQVQLNGIFKQGYGISPKVVMRDQKLSIEAKAIYAYLSSYSGQGMTSFPSVDLVCHELGISRHRFIKHRKQLEERGYIAVHQVTENGKFKSNLYTINVIPTYQNTTSVNEASGNSTSENNTTNKNNPTNNNLNNNTSTTTPISPKGDDDEVAYKTIVELYHENLPNLPTVRLPTSARRKAVRARIKDDAKRKELDWWAGYFKYVSTMPFLNGANDRGWTANFDWLINETNMVKVIEGKYQHD